jgi:hypothetical protein
MIRTVQRRRSPNFRNQQIRGAASTATGLTSLASAGISAGVALASTAVTDWMNSIQLSHDADTATTLIVNGLATQLSNLDSAYLSEPNPTCADQRAALDAYDQAWAWLQSPAACGNPSYGAAGNACISDRAPGGKYPWQTYYRDPIANDPRVANLGCDTGIDVELPSVTTGTYEETGITSTGGSATTGQTAAQIAAGAIAAASVPASTAAAPSSSLPATIVSGIPNIAIYAVIGLVAFMFLAPSGKAAA